LVAWLLLLLDENRNIILFFSPFLGILQELVGRMNTIDVSWFLIFRLSSELMDMLSGTLFDLHDMIVCDVIDIVVDVIVNYCNVKSSILYALLFETRVAALLCLSSLVVGCGESR
jgi:hypothetical protein